MYLKNETMDWNKITTENLIIIINELCELLNLEKLIFSLQFEKKIENINELYIEDLVPPEVLYLKVNEIIQLGASLGAMKNKFTAPHEIYEYILRMGWYKKTSNGIDWYKKDQNGKTNYYHRVKLDFSANLSILNNEDFIKLIYNKEIRKFYILYNGFQLKIMDEGSRLSGSWSGNSESWWRNKVTLKKESELKSFI
jgi:hypothetical protein